MIASLVLLSTLTLPISRPTDGGLRPSPEMGMVNSYQESTTILEDQHGHGPEVDLVRLVADFDFAELVVAPAPLQYPDPDFRAFHRVLGRNFSSNLFDKGNLSTLLIGSAASASVRLFRDDIRDAIEGKAPWLGNFGNVLGGALVQNVSAAGLLLIVPLTDDAKFRSFAFTVAQGKILNAALTYGIKFGVSRTRPNSADEYSFPSGHASGTFMYANLIHRYYGTKAGIVAYGLASVVGVSRLEAGEHWASDVVFGATIGILSAQTVARGTDRAFGARSTIVVPLVSDGRRGVLLVMEF